MADKKSHQNQEEVLKVESSRFSVILFLIVFIEGAAVMAIELAGVKMIAPFYGTTLYVWAAVLSVTLGGLASGYFLGGQVASKFPGTKSAPLILFIGAFLVFIMPYTSQVLMTATSSLSIRTGPLFSALFFILPPLICMGMISPIIIQLGTKELNKAGRFAGSVYALSTVGGIIMTLLTGLYFLPEWGIKSTILLVTLMLCGISVLSFLVLRRFVMTGITIILALLFMLFASGVKEKKGTNNVWVLSQSEGMLGQVTVFDYLDQDNFVMRSMLINGIPQTFLAKEYAPISAWPYIHRISTIASTKEEGSKALLIGMAGGTIAMELTGMGFKTDIVEIDPRMPKLAEEFFSFDQTGMNIYIDDGRHFLNTTENSYDLVIIDALNGEVQPNQLYTLEAFDHLRNVFSKNGLLILNFQGYVFGEKGLATRSIMKTLEKAGFKLKLYFSADQQNNIDDVDGDIHIIAYLGEQNFENIQPNRLNICCKAYAYTTEELFTDLKVDYSDGQILLDNKPALEKMNVAWTELWRERKLRDYTNQLSRHDFPLFE